jgi:hypothetical protein
MKTLAIHIVLVDRTHPSCHVVQCLCAGRAVLVHVPPMLLRCVLQAHTCNQQFSVGVKASRRVQGLLPASTSTRTHTHTHTHTHTSTRTRTRARARSHPPRRSP